MSETPITPDSNLITPIPTALDVWANQPFQSRAEEREAFASSRYSDPSDEAFRTACRLKLSITSYLDEPRIHSGTGAQSSNPNAAVGRASIQLTQEDAEGVQQHIEAQRKEAERQEALKAHERHVATELTIPTGPPIDRTKPPEGFKDRDELVRHMRDRRYSTDTAYRTWVEARVIASDF